MSIDFGADLYEEPIVAKTFLSEDANEGSLRPHTLAEYIGQEKAKQNLSIFIEAARRRTESLDHVAQAQWVAHWVWVGRDGLVWHDQTGF